MFLFGQLTLELDKEATCLFEGKAISSILVAEVVSEMWFEYDCLGFCT